MVTDFVYHDTGLVKVTLETPMGVLRFIGCWDGKRWHPNDKPIWTLNEEDIVDVPNPTKPTKRSFEAAVRAWMGQRPCGQCGVRHCLFTSLSLPRVTD